MFDEKLNGLTPKQDAFACAYVETGTRVRRTGALTMPIGMKPEGIAVNASKLLKDTKVSLRVEQLQAAHAERHNVTIDRLTDELELARQGAVAAKQFGAAVAATMAKARLHGFLNDDRLVSPREGLPPPIINVVLHGSEPTPNYPKPASDGPRHH